MNAEIAEAIIAARVASDSGKDMSDLFDQLVDNGSFRNAYDDGYAAKDHYIFRAMSRIRALQCREFYYYVDRDEETGRSGSFIVYFNFKVNGKRYQISFHSFNEKLRPYLKDRGHCRTEWDKKDGKSAALALAKACGFAK